MSLNELGDHERDRACERLLTSSRINDYVYIYIYDSIINVKCRKTRGSFCEGGGGEKKDSFE